MGTSPTGYFERHVWLVLKIVGGKQDGIVKTLVGNWRRRMKGYTAMGLGITVVNRALVVQKGLTAEAKLKIDVLPVGSIVQDVLGVVVDG
jgi:hypothetical protein